MGNDLQPPQTPATTYAMTRAGERIGSLQRVEKDTVLVVRSYAFMTNLVLGVRARVLDDTGGIAYVEAPHTPKTDRSALETYVLLPAGYLLDVAVVSTSLTPRRGQCYVVLALAHRYEPIPEVIQPIAKGYVATGAGLIWPHGAWVDSIEGPGIELSGTISNPAAGADFAVTVPTGARWQVRSIWAQLVTSGVANTRVVSLQVTDGTNVLFTIPYTTGQAASLTRQYYWANYAYNIGLVGTGIYTPVPFPFTLFAGWKVQSSTALIDAGDQWSLVRVYYEENLEA